MRIHITSPSIYFSLSCGLRTPLARHLSLVLTTRHRKLSPASSQYSASFGLKLLLAPSTHPGDFAHECHPAPTVLKRLNWTQIQECFKIRKKFKKVTRVKILYRTANKNTVTEKLVDPYNSPIPDKNFSPCVRSRILLHTLR